MEKCLFCQIVRGEIPCHKVYEDEKTLAFLDIAPVNPGHTLVIPKEHFASLEDIPSEELSFVIQAVKKVGAALKQALGVEGYNVQVNNGAIAGQVINHLHFHLIPRLLNDGLKLWPQKSYATGEAEKIAAKIKEFIK